MSNDRHEAIGANYGYAKEVKVYPYILLKNYIDDVEILLRNLPEGDIPVCLYYEGEELKTKKGLDRSLIALSTLANIQGFILKIAPNVEYPIKSAAELLNVKEFDWKGVG